MKGGYQVAIENEYSKELKRKRRYNTKVNNRHFKRHRLQQWGSRRCGYIPLLEDDMDIMERIDIFDTII